MRPVKQTKFGTQGNCLAACLASLLSLPLEQVPEFPGNTWFNDLYLWLLDQGYRLCESDSELLQHGNAVAVGQGPRGWRHAVVWYDGRMLHDPHPDNTGLQKDPDQFLYCVPV